MIRHLRLLFALSVLALPAFPQCSWLFNPFTRKLDCTGPGAATGLTAGAVPFASGGIGFSQDPTHFAYTATGPLGPYLSIGTTSQVNTQLISFKGTAASHATETTILGDFFAAFDGINSPFGIQGLVINDGTNGPQNCPGVSCNPFVGHAIGLEGNAQENGGNGALILIGVEGRADQITSAIAAQQHYTGVLGVAIKSFNGNNTQTMKSLETVLQSCNSSANTFSTGGPNNDYPGGHLVCSSPDAHGVGIGLHVTQIQGFAQKYGIFGDGDPWLNQGPIGATQINDTNGNAELILTPTASAVDQLTITNAATANPATVFVSATGTDTNVGIGFITKGTGAYGFFTHGAGSQFQIVDTAGTIVNQISASGNTTGNAPTLTASGTDSVVDLGAVCKGTGCAIAPGNGLIYSKAANVTVAQVNSGFNLVPAVTGHTLRLRHFYIAARGGAAATCTDVRLGDSNNANAIVIDPIANLSLNTGNTEGTSTIAQSGFGATAFTAGLGINIFKSGSSCGTVTSFDTEVEYTIN